MAQPPAPATSLAGLLAPSTAMGMGITGAACTGALTTAAAGLLAPAAAPAVGATTTAAAAAFIPPGLAPIGTPSAANLASLGSGPATPREEQDSDSAFRRSLDESGMATTTPGGTPRRLPIFSRLVDEEHQLSPHLAAAAAAAAAEVAAQE